VYSIPDRFNLTVSIVVPVYNCSATLRRCLSAVRQSSVPIHEIIVVDDGSSDNSVEIARSFGAQVLECARQSGPAYARNRGARAASGDILLFIDADVLIRPDTIARVIETLGDTSLHGVFGSYDFTPAAPEFFSQYKNLLHSWMHQNGRRSASTFWTGCGAVHRDFFLASGGFDERWTRPSVEDIEFGARVIRAGARIRLDPELQVTHLKRWTFCSLVRTDVFDRAIPWTTLILRDGRMPNDLNVEMLQRFSVALACLAPLLALYSPLLGGLALALVISLNLPFYRFLASQRGFLFALRSVPLHVFYFLYSGFGMAAGMAAWALVRERAVKRKVAASAQ